MRGSTRREGLSFTKIHKTATNEKWLSNFVSSSATVSLLRELGRGSYLHPFIVSIFKKYPARTMNYLSGCRNYKYFCLGTVHYTSSVSGGVTTNTQHKKLITFEVKYNPTSKFRLKNPHPKVFLSLCN